MKNARSIVGLVLMFFALESLPARAELSAAGADLIPTSISIRRERRIRLGQPLPRIRITVEAKNVGTQPTEPMQEEVEVLVGSEVLYGLVYGPVSRGSLPGDRILPGETGRLVVGYRTFPLSRCQKVLVRIDLKGRWQQDGFVLQNDQRTMTVYDWSNPRACVDPIFEP